MYEQLLLFPERAEFLAQGRFDGYRVSLDHWRALAGTFRGALESVYRRQSARVLLVHGAQGHGKSLFVQTLVKDFDSSRVVQKFDNENLWHVLSGGAERDAATVREARTTTSLRRVEARPGWLKLERDVAVADQSRLRVLLFDNAEKEQLNCEWADRTRNEYAQHRDTALRSVAERIVEDCRGDFARSLFVLLSNDPKYLKDLQTELERSHRGLAEYVELPLPEPSIKEEIVRTNVNLLNPRSYWFCLDQGGPQEKLDAYSTLVDDKGFADSFQAIDRALAARTKRTGRPANKNLLTLVTLGTPPTEVQQFIDDLELTPDENAVSSHVGVWLFRARWASALQVGDSLSSRRASLVESEFSLRWVALDMVATWTLCTAQPSDPVASQLVRLIEHVPSIADKKATKEQFITDVAAASAALSARALAPEVAAFAADFTSKGQQRFQDYEPPIAARFGKRLSHGLQVRSALKPDIILAEYEPCAVTRATKPEVLSIEAVIKRSCHVIELTAHLREGMQGFDDYLIDKVRAYAELLESV